MNYSMMIDAHVIRQADLTLATISVATNEASRFGIVGVDAENRVNSFVEKPYQPPSNRLIWVFICSTRKYWIIFIG
jgi:glucose-1-phosphate adenylyltransferase